MDVREHLPGDERVKRIRRRIRAAERTLLMRYQFLGDRDAVASFLTMFSVVAMLGLGWLYATGVVPWYVCLLGNAFFASILHEIEHDLIHFLYFRSRRLAHNAVMLLVWIFRGNIVHGWYRRALHFHHHRASGTESDVEERLLGLGMPWGPRRLLVMVDGAMAFLVNARTLQEQVPGFRRRELAWASFPVYPVFAFVLVSFLVYQGLISLSGLGLFEYSPSYWFALVYPAIDVLAVAWVFPNYLRQAALQIVSSNVHYYGDVEGLHQETQILRPFYLWPLQLFCFNFGATHAFHHYVVEQPFYVRQLIAPAVQPALARYGVRVNDTGTFFRANRYRLAA